MKHYLLIVLSILSFNSFSQNPPIAVDDTVYFEFYQTGLQDTVTISSFQLLKNDYDTFGFSIAIESFIYSGTHFLDVELNTDGTIGYFYYLTPANFEGTETFQYVLKNEVPNPLYDTATVTIIIKKKTYEILDANNINAIIDKNALFANPNLKLTGFEAPKNSRNMSIYAANLWVTGKNGATFHTNVRKLGNFARNYNNYWSGFTSNSGPVSDVSHTDSLVNSTWDRVWKVKQYEIDYHLANWNSSGYTPPPSFLDWPAHGDTTIGEPYYVAPFVDYDGDGNYNPMFGDYPKIKGDQAIFFIYNDGLSILSYNEMITEVHGLAYAFQCTDSALQNTIFVDYKIVNRSNNTYDSTYFGMFSDLEIGYSSDDYVQCDVDKGMYFGYNAIDTDTFNTGRPGYGFHPPAQGVITLKGAKQDNDGQDNAQGIGSNETVNGTGFNDGIIDNEHWGMEFFQYFNNGTGINGDPNFDIDYYTYLTGRWRDYSKMVYGGNGHQNSTGATSTPTRFAFPNASDSYHYGTGGIAMPAWTENSVMTAPGDRRGVSSTGPVTFAPGDEINLTYAFVFGRDYVNAGSQAGVTKMLVLTDSIRSYYSQGILNPCGFPVSVNNQIEVTNNLVIYPNPTKGILNIRQDNSEAITIQLIDITGKELLIASTSDKFTTLDISNLTSGIYLVKVRTRNQTVVQKIIKQ